MVAVGRPMDQQRRWFAYMENDHVYVAVIVDVAERRPPPARQRNLPQPGDRGDILESAVPRGAAQLHWFAVFRPAGACAQLTVHVSVRDEDIQPAGISEAHESGSPFYVWLTVLRSLLRPADI